MLAGGYDAVEASYDRVEFEHAELPVPFDAVVA
jgi:hypothetical protein